MVLGLMRLSENGSKHAVRDITLRNARCSAPPGKTFKVRSCNVMEQAGAVESSCT